MKYKIVQKYSFILILFQSCVAYNKIPVSLADAKDKGRGRITYDSGEKFKFQNIVQIDTAYYTVERVQEKNSLGHHSKSLNPSNISSIYLEKPKKSILQNTLLFYVIANVGMTAIIVFLSY